MCLATPCKIIQINGKSAVVKSEGREYAADLSLVKNIKKGDYVLIHEDLVIQKLEENEAAKILEMIKTYH